MSSIRKDLEQIPPVRPNIQDKCFLQLRKSEGPLSMILLSLLPSYMQYDDSALLVHIVDNLPHEVVEKVVPHPEEPMAVRRFALLMTLEVTRDTITSPSFKQVTINRKRVIERTALPGHTIDNFVALTHTTSGTNSMKKIEQRVERQLHAGAWVQQHRNEFADKTLPQIQKVFQQALPDLRPYLTKRRVREVLEAYDIPFQTADFATRRRFIEEFYQPGIPMNFSEVARSLGVNSDTVSRWYSLASQRRLRLQPDEYHTRMDHEKRHQIATAIAALQSKGYAWRHSDTSQRINSARIAAELEAMGIEMTSQQVVNYLSNKRQTSQPVGEKMRPLIDVIPEVDRYISQGVTDPEKIIEALKTQYQQDFTRVTEAKIRAHVLQPKIEAFVEMIRAQRGTIPTLEEVKIHLGLPSIKIPTKVYKELGLL